MRYVECGLTSLRWWRRSRSKWMEQDRHCRILAFLLHVVSLEFGVREFGAQGTGHSLGRRAGPGGAPAGGGGRRVWILAGRISV
jgi:hypothetical protein